MPELPDVELYLDALDRHIGGSELQAVRCGNPFLLHQRCGLMPRRRKR
jgi:formamidopyrimidine-DNA glycosylase